MTEHELCDATPSGRRPTSWRADPLSLAKHRRHLARDYAGNPAWTLGRPFVGRAGGPVPSSDARPSHHPHRVRVALDAAAAVVVVAARRGRCATACEPPTRNPWAVRSERAPGTTLAGGFGRRRLLRPRLTISVRRRLFSGSRNFLIPPPPTIRPTRSAYHTSFVPPAN